MTFKEFKKWVFYDLDITEYPIEEIVYFIRIYHEICDLPFLKRKKYWDEKYKETIKDEIIKRRK